MKPVRLVNHLRDDEKLMTWARRCFRQGIEAGAWPDYRHAPDGNERVVVIEHDTPQRLGLGTERPEGQSANGTAPLGFATYFFPYPRKSFIWIDLLWVEPAFRRQGIATALLRAIGDEHGPCHLQFGTIAENAGTHALAESLGWRAHATIYEGFSQ
jgi:GNAT superfamily N-acetyltransferase